MQPDIGIGSPFTLDRSWIEAYKVTLRHLSTPSLYGEILRLEVSLKHLQRSNEELKIHETSVNEDTSWIAPVITENEQVIAKQSQQVDLVKAELSDRGTVSDHADLAVNEQSNAPAEIRTGANQVPGRMEVDESSDGVHL